MMMGMDQKDATDHLARGNSMNSAEMLDLWEKRFAAEPAAADRAMLTAARKAFERESSSAIDANLARVGARLYFHLGDLPRAVDLLRRYLNQELPLEDEFWARWELVDKLAMQRRCPEAVAAQRSFFEWARERFGPDRLLQVMSDATQALCWREIGAAEDWFRHVEAITAASRPTAANRLERFYCARTAANLLLSIGAHERALEVIATIDALATEDRSWSDRWWIEIEGRIAGLNILAAMESPELLPAAGMVTEEIRANEHVDSTHAGRERLRTLYHSAAAALYFARRYAAAIPLFERAIALGTLSPHSYAWLAACRYMTGTPPTQLTPLIDEAAVRWQGATREGILRSTPELRALATSEE
jgi:tetratricopeptide (TPR) repeat protein